MTDSTYWVEGDSGAGHEAAAVIPARGATSPGREDGPDLGRYLSASQDRDAHRDGLGPAWPDCRECSRLAEQERAAALTGDRSRRTDVRVLWRRHATAAHGIDPEPMPTRSIEPGSILWAQPHSSLRV
ncbi:hypothetical protein ABIA33_006438 [Streptacidiphilus sp. MAP12-16]|uniref:hypothetical protein n=1 Tax=Streptacidiphilus sp. MAP12-16 TaxID=3156300 RepID=UPI003511D64D